MCRSVKRELLQLQRAECHTPSILRDHAQQTHACGKISIKAFKRVCFPWVHNDSSNFLYLISLRRIFVRSCLALGQFHISLLEQGCLESWYILLQVDTGVMESGCATPMQLPLGHCHGMRARLVRPCMPAVLSCCNDTALEATVSHCKLEPPSSTPSSS